MFTITVTHTIDNNGELCGNCEHCIYDDGGDYHPYYICRIYDEVLPFNGSKWDPIPCRLQKCIDAEFESTVEQTFEEK